MRTSPLRAAALAMAAATSAALAAGCESSTGSATGQLTVRLADAPLAGVQSATVWISRVYLIGGSETTGTQYSITSAPVSYNLLTLQGGVTAALGTVTIPTGTYSQMRFVVDSARITLLPPLTFSDLTTSKTLKVPSGMQTGIKVTFESPLQVTAGQTILVADFDVSQNFVFTGPLSLPTGVLFKPVIHATAENVAGSISGTVTPASAKAKLYAIFTTTTDTVATALADTVTGAYTLRFLPPGAYTVTAVGASLNVSKTLTLRAAQDTTGVNFP